MVFPFLRSLVLGCCVAMAPVAFAQDATALFRQAPPEVEEALRKTTREFFDLQVEKKWGASMKYIAEDSLDAYIGSEKDSCMAIEVMNITYNDEYTDATVAILCERGMATPVGGGRVRMPFTTYWRRVDSDWKWYAPKFDRDPEEEMVMTPFGPIPKRTPDQKPGEQAKRSPDSDTKLVAAVSLKDVKTPLEANPGTVVLAPDKPGTATAQVYNRFAGITNVELRWVPMKGLDASIDKEKLAQNEVAEVTISYEPQGIAMPPEKHAVWIETFPMRSATPIVIEFKFDGQESSSAATKANE